MLIVWGGDHRKREKFEISDSEGDPLDLSGEDGSQNTARKRDPQETFSDILPSIEISPTRSSPLEKHHAWQQGTSEIEDLIEDDVGEESYSTWDEDAIHTEDRANDDDEKREDCRNEDKEDCRSRLSTPDVVS